MIVRLLLPAVAALMLAGCVVTTTEVVRTHPDAVGGRQPSLPAGTSVAEHVVARGETLYAIAFRRGLDWRSLAGWNGLQAPYTIYPGQRLKLGPASRAPAVASAPAAPTSPAGAQARAPASSAGQTGARPSAGTATGIASTASTPAAQRAAISQPSDAIVAVDATSSTPPSATSGTGTSASTAGTPSTNPVSTPPTTPATSPVTSTTRPEAPAAQPSETPPAALPAPDPAAPTTSVGGIRWRWPTHGEVIQRFTGSDLTRQGINIAGRSGQAVVAAADGEVVYSGSGLRGYGELIIIKHSADYLSAYGHNRKRLVAEGQRVTAGQPIAELGRTGTDRDKLHFEIRHSGKPVDPLKYLPRR